VTAIAKVEQPKNAAAYAAKLNDVIAEYDLGYYDNVAFNLVLLPEKLPVDETERAADDLRTFGIHVRSVIINEVIPREVLQGNWFLERRRATQDKYLALIEEKFKDLIRAEVPLFESDIYSVDNLRKVGRELYG